MSADAGTAVTMSSAAAAKTALILDINHPRSLSRDRLAAAEQSTFRLRVSKVLDFCGYMSQKFTCGAIKDCAPAIWLTGRLSGRRINANVCAVARWKRLCSADRLALTHASAERDAHIKTTV